MASLRKRWPWLVGMLSLLVAVCARSDVMLREQGRLQADRLAQQLAVGSGGAVGAQDLSWLALYPAIRSGVVTAASGQVLGRYQRDGGDRGASDYQASSGRDAVKVLLDADLPSWPTCRNELPLLALAVLLLTLAIPARKGTADLLPRSVPANDALSILDPIESVPGSLVLELDAAMKIQRVSRGVERFGYTTQQLLGVPVSDFVERFHPGHHESKIGVAHAAGGRLDSLLTSASIQGESGSLEKVVVTLAPPGGDELQARYSSLQRLCQAICDNARDAVVFVDRSATVVYANLSFLAASPQRVMAGQGLLGAVSPQYRLALTDAIQAALDGQHDGILEFELEPPSTAIFEGAFHALNRPGERGGCLAVGIFREVSTARRMAQELELARQRAGHSQKIEALGRMAGGVAHDFNNLLATVVFNLEAAQAALDPQDPALPYLEEMRLATDRACSVTRQLLLYSRKKPAELCRVSCHQAIRDAVRLTKSTRGSIQVITSLKASDDHVMLDDGQLDQVLVNLLVNARDAIGQDGRIEISTESIEFPEAGQPAILLKVKDTGSGIPPEIQSKIFEPYFTTKEVGKGTGLGLSTALAIVEKAGGQMSLSSSPAGTVFEIRLRLAAPRSETVASPVASVDTPRPAAQGQAADSAGLKEDANVLLVEDEVAIRTLVHRLLEQRGYRVTSAGSGSDAAEILHGDQPFDVLVTDLVLPGMSGPELAKVFQESHPGGPVLFMSGFPGDTLDETDVSLNSRFLAKPFSHDQLLGSLRQLLAQSVR